MAEICRSDVPSGDVPGALLYVYCFRKKVPMKLYEGQKLILVKILILHCIKNVQACAMCCCLFGDVI